MTTERWRRSRHLNFNHQQTALERLSARGPASGICRLRIEPLEDRCLLAFAPAVPYATSNIPIALVSADFNYDGNVDLAVAANGSDQVTVHLGTGNGTFQSGASQTIVDEPFWAKAADFNSDGKLDLAVPVYGSNVVSVLLGNGNGTFQNRVDYAAGNFPTSVDSGDLNGDGKLDLAVVNNLGMSVRVLLGNGNGTFQNGVNYGIHQSFGVALADFNKDGKLDVAASGYMAGVVSVLFGNGDGTLQSKVDYAVGPNPYNVVVADLDRDGNLDIATPAYGANYVSVLYGNGVGAFPSRVDVPTGVHPISVSIADLNMDGKLDFGVAISDPNPDTSYSIGVLHGNADRTFQSQVSYTVGNSPRSIIAGDFDRNGSPDLAVANEQSASISILLNTAVGPPVVTSISQSAAEVGETLVITGGGFLGNTALDEVWFGEVRATVNAASTTQLTVQVPAGAVYSRIRVANSGRSGFSPSFFTPRSADAGTLSAAAFAVPTLILGGYLSWSEVGDIDGDGRVDVVTSNYDNNNWKVFRNNVAQDSLNATQAFPADSLAAPFVYSLAYSPQAGAIGDLDGDGKLDVVLTDYQQNTISLFRNTSSPGSVSFGARVVMAAGTTPLAAAITDVDGDGQLDILVANSGYVGNPSHVDNRISLYRNRSSSPGNFDFEPPVHFTVGVGPYGVAAADLNGDGKVEIIAGSISSQVVTILTNQSTGPGVVAFGNRVDISTGQLIYDVLPGDFNGDGRMDLFVSNYNTGARVLYNNVSSGVIDTNSFATFLPLTNNQASPNGKLGDLDGDADLEVVLSSDSNSNLAVHVNGSPVAGNPPLGFTSFVLNSGQSFPGSISIVDFDGDGRNDLVSASPNGQQVSLQRNIIQSNSIASRVWRDTDADGIQDAGETGVAGAVVELFNPVDGVVGNGNDLSLGTSITDASGNYTFANLTESSHYLEFRTPVGFSFTTQDAGGNDTLDSDANSATGRTAIFSLAAGQNDMSRDAGLVGAFPAFGWAKLQGSSDFDSGYDIATDAAGFVYAAGMSTLTAGQGGHGAEDIVIAKYTAVGALMWQRVLGGSLIDEGQSIAVDSSGNVYVSGIFRDTVDFDPGPGVTNITSVGEYDAFVMKFDANGNLLWAKTAGSAGVDESLGLALDGLGGVIITGMYQLTVDFDPGPGSTTISNAAAGVDIFLWKLAASDGAFQWVRGFGGAGSGEDVAYDVATDVAGNIYVTGSYMDSVDFDPGPGNATLTSTGSSEIFVLKMTSAGGLVWAKSIGGTQFDRAYGVEVDASGNVYATGYVQGIADLDPGMGTSSVSSAGLQDVVVVKLDSNGGFVWGRLLGGTGRDISNALTLDNASNVYVTGYFESAVDFDPGAGTYLHLAQGQYDAYLWKLTTAGNLAAAMQFGGTSDESALGVVVDSAATIYLTGNTNGTVDFDPSAAQFNLTSVGDRDGYHWKLYASALPTPATVGNLVWNDLDSDGIQDAGEPGMSGVVVELFNSADGIIGNGNDVSLGTQTTDVNGSYSFATVPAGAYYLRFRKPNGLIFSPHDAGSDDALDSDANYYGFTEVFAQAAGQTDASRDAGLRSATDRIVFASNRDGDFDIWEMDTSGANVVQLLNVAGSDNNGSWSPSGDKLLFSSDRDGDPDVYVMNADGSGVTKLTNNTTLDSGPVWSPDGSKIAFVSQRDGNYEIYVMNADGSNQTRLTNNAAQDLAPDWSPDGFRLVFYSDRTGGGDIYVVNVSGGTPTRLTTHAASDTTPHFSPDGIKIAFDSARDGDDEIWVMNADGSSPVQLTFNTQFDQGPRWSPDGTKLVFYRDFGVNREVFTMNANGSNETNISNNSASDDNPAWSQVANTAIGDLVWNDLDSDGIRDAGEPGVAGAVVELFDPVDGVIGNGNDVSRGVQVTDANGQYSFANTALGSYYLEFRTPVGFIFSPQDAGGNDSLDSDANASTGRTAIFTFLGAQNDTSRDAGLIGAAPGFGWAVTAGGSLEDSAGAIARDSSGNLYISGNFHNGVDFDNGPGVYNLTGFDTGYLAKYTSTGALVWARAFTNTSAGQSLAVGSSGDVFMTGLFQGTVDFDPGSATFNMTTLGGRDTYVVRISTTGQFVWARQIGGAGAGSEGVALTVDTSDNVYITPYFTGTVDADPGPSVSNHASAGSIDFLVVKLDSAGSLVWEQAFGSVSTDQATSIAVDSVGDVVVTGYFGAPLDFDPGPSNVTVTAASGSDAFLLKLHASGSLAWASRIAGDTAAIGYGVAIGPGDSVYATGVFHGTGDFDPGAGTSNLTSNGQGDVYVAKLTTAGSLVWARAMGGSDNDGGEDIAVDASGIVYAIGKFSATADFDPGVGTFNLTSAGSTDGFLTRLDANGNLISAGAVGGSQLDSGTEVVVDGAGGAYVAGTFSGTSDFDPGSGTFSRSAVSDRDLFLAKFLVNNSAIGNFVWNDLNSNGMQDPGEPGLAGVAVELFNPVDGIVGNGNDVSLGTRITDASGSYLFSAVVPGSYYLKFQRPTTYHFTTPDVGSNDELDSDANSLTGGTAIFPLAFGQIDSSHDAGLRLSTTTTTVSASVNPAQLGENVTLTASVNFDLQGFGLPGGTVTLLDGNTVLATGLVPQPATWSSVASMSGVRRNLASATGPDGRIYAIGGYDGSSFLNTLEAYNPTTNSWATLANMPTARYTLAAVTGLDGRIYAIGGSLNGGAGGELKTLEAYDPLTNTWATLANMSVPRSVVSATLGLDGRIYVVGGFNQSGFLNTSEAYDPQTNTWTPIASMAVARGDAAVVTGADGRIYAIGGFNSTLGLDSVEAYNISTNTWVSVSSLPTPRFDLAASVGPDGRLYAIGGFSSGAVSSVLAYDTSTNTWSPIASLTVPRAYVTATLGSDGRIYVMGGYDSGTLSSAEALNFSATTLAFSTSSLTAGTRTITAVYSGNSDFAGSTSAPLTLVITDSPAIENVYPADMAGIAATDPIEQGERLVSSIPKVVVVFSESMATTGMANINSAHNWQLKRNDVDITTQISGISFGFNATTNRYEALLSFTSPLSDGSYELTAQSTLTDLTGNHVDGDFDGFGFGEDYSHRFTIARPVAAGSEFRVNTNTTGAQRTFFWSPQTVASDASGNFAITWSSYGQDGSGYGVYAQRYSAAGVAQGSEFRVNSFATSQQRNATIAMDLEGDFVVAWTSYAQDGNSYGIYARRFSADGSPQGSEFQVNTYTTNLQTFPMVAMDADGDFVIAWSSSYQDASGWGIAARRYNSLGVPQGSDFQVNTYTTGNQIYAAVAIDASGDFVVTWSSNGQDGSVYGVYARQYSAAGVPQGTEFRVNTYTSFSQEYSTVGMDAAGNYVITWSSFIQEGSWSVYGQRFNAAGSMLGSEFRINLSTTDAHQYSSVAVDADGDFFVTWSSFLQDGTWDVRGNRFSAIGVPQGSEFRVNSTLAGDQVYASAATNSTGDIVVAWSSTGQDGSGYGVYAQRYAAPAVISSMQIAGDPTEIAPGERLVQTIPAGPSLKVVFSHEMSQLGGSGGATSVTNPANWMLTHGGVDISSQIASVSYSGTAATISLSSTLSDGNYVLTAKSAIQDIHGQTLDGDSNGTPGGDFTRAFSIQLPVTTGSEFRVNAYTTGTQGGFNLTAQAVAADASGDYVVTWTSNAQDGSSYGIYAQRYNSSGLPLGGEFRVNSYTTGLQLLSSVAMSDAGDFVVTWSDFGGFGSSHTGVFAQRYDAAGVPRESEFQVNSHTTGAQLLSSIAIDADGDFVITWSSLNQDGSNYGIYARRYSADGVVQGSEFRVNTYTTSSQRNSSVAMDAGGNFVVAWQSYEQDGNQHGIYAQRYSASGTPLGSEFRASTTTFLEQQFATVALSDAGDFVIAWSSVQDGNILGIYGQRFASNGLPQGSEFRINSYTTDTQQYARVAMDADGDFVVAWKSNNQDGSDYGIFAQRFSAAGTAQGSEFRINSTTTNRQLEQAVAMDSDGDFIVVWSSLNQDGSNYGVYAQRYVGAPQLQIVSMTPTYTGFEIEFNRDVNSAVLNLYNEGGTLGVADVTLTGAISGAVRGSVVVEPGSRKLTFIKSGGPLAPDVYTIGLRSNAAGFIDPSGNLLDGNGDGSGDDYLARFTITPPAAGVTLGVGDFTRGYGQAVNLPPSAVTGIPITISNALAVKSASFALVYDPALLSITGATLGSGITGTVSLDTSLVGIARLTVSSGTQLSATAGLQTLVNLTASVPSAAPYSSKQILELSSIQLTNTALAKIPAIDDDGIHVAAYFGDANGSQSYNAPDATATQRLIVGTNTGFIAYQLADPYLIVDINGNGQVQSDDVTQIQRAIVGLSTPNIPLLPALSPAATGGPDPIISIPQNLVASVGETVTVPVELLVTEPTGITLSGADIAIAYDSSTLELTDADVGQLLIGFGLSVNMSTPGLIRLTLGGSPLDLDYYTSGVLARLQFTVIAGAGTTARINLLQSSAALQTALYDSAGNPLTLSPAPTNGDDDEVDGVISILGNDRREAGWKLPAVDMAFDSEDDFTAELPEEFVVLN